MLLPQVIHFTGIGNPVCAALALHLLSKGYTLSGSDPLPAPDSSEALRAAGIPLHLQWSPEKIRAHAVVAGPGLSADNPELQYARQAGLKIYYYPQLVYELSKDKQRIVVTGGRGRSSLTALLIHVLQYHNRAVDFVVESQISWLRQHIQFSQAPLIVIEGNELPDPFEKKAGFLHYHHHIGVITYINREAYEPFATEEDYVAQFDNFADNTPKAGILLYNESHTLVSVIGAKQRPDVTPVPYSIHPHTSDGGQNYVLNGAERITVKVFGTQNFESITAARELLKRVGLPADKFYQALLQFTL